MLTIYNDQHALHQGKVEMFRGELVPQDPADEIRRRGELERELRALGTETARLQNVEALKREARKRRLAESRQKQKETKERRERPIQPLRRKKYNCPAATAPISASELK